MNTWIRRGAWALGGLLLVLAAVAVWFVATFDANSFKKLAIEWVKTHKDRTLAIDGPIEL
jgi:AsmA protein